MLFSLCLLTGCVDVNAETPKQQKEKFKVFHSEDRFNVIVDKETGVEYIIYISGYKGGITPRYNQDGTLKVNEDWDVLK